MSFLLNLVRNTLKKTGMKRGLLCAMIIVLCLTHHSIAQTTLPQPTPGRDTGQVIHLLNADILMGIQGKDSTASQRQKLIGNVRLQQGHTIFTSDSAIRYMNKNILDAYGHIHINQADSIDTYADELHYVGDTKIATLRNHVKMTDGNMILTTNYLDYNMDKHIGIYYHGGKLINQETTLTSEKGEYFADRKDVYFKENVRLNNPQYKLTTDTLLYNTVNHIATFIAPTAINTGETIIYTSCGYYSTDQQFSFLCNRPTIVDSTGTLTADSLKFSKEEGVGRAFGDIVWSDTSGQATVQSDFAISNNKQKTLLATRHALLIFAQGKDSLFVTSDTLFSGPIIPVEALKDSMKKDTIPYVYLPNQDSSQSLTINDINLTTPESDSSKRVIRPLEVAQKNDTIQVPLFIPTAIRKFMGLTHAQGSSPSPAQDTIPEVDLPSHKDSINTLAKQMQPDSATEQPLLTQQSDSTVATSLDSLDATNTEQQQTVDSADARNLIAYHHVRLYSDSLQGIADSLYYSGIDSSFHFYGNPVIWTGETQLFGDSIVLVTKNQKPYKLILQQHAMIINKVGPDAYNQIKGRVITGYFNDSSQLDWMNVAGNAESVYFAQEDSTGAVIGINKATASFIKLFFKDNHLHQVKFFKDISGSFLNPNHIKKEDITLKGFKWESKKRPPRKPPIPRIKVKKKVYHGQEDYPSEVKGLELQ